MKPRKPLEIQAWRVGYESDQLRKPPVSDKSWRVIIGAAAGFVFGLGLIISGMTDPNKVIGFLDVTGEWDPTLMFVLAGAVVPNLFVFGKILKAKAPIFDTKFHLPEQTHLTPSLIVGSALFGVGWGLSGYCPGPAVVASASGAAPVLAFTLTMVLSTFSYRWITAQRAPQVQSNPEPSGQPLTA